MVADKELVRERELRIRTYLKDLQKFADISEPEFRRNKERQYAVLHALQLAIEATIEIGTHICSAEAIGVPASYSDTFRLLADNQIIDFQLAERLQKMAQFRNRIVHLYWDVDLAQVYEIMQNSLNDFNDYLRDIENFLDNV